MNVSVFIKVPRSAYVPEQGRNAWLDQHGVPPEVSLLECVASGETWESIGVLIQEDGTIPLDSSGESRFPYGGSIHWAKAFLLQHAADLARKAGRVNSPITVDTLLLDEAARRVADDQAREASRRENEQRDHHARNERDRLYHEKTRLEAEQITAERRALLVQYGSAEQLERFDEGVLPEGELCATLKANLFTSGLERFVGISAEEVRADCEESDCDVGFYEKWRKEIGPLSASEWQHYKAIVAAYEGHPYTLRIVEESGVCKDSSHRVMRLRAHFVLRVAGLDLDTDYAL